ncbi:Flp pilus assembly complex ATPase component TadA, partial [Candidatus Parcubacteria bacterium]|nr:Flp pilus assembly complex ATPase component TadA [Candidatus Parcubacteria bacterium]
MPDDKKPFSSIEDLIVSKSQSQSPTDESSQTQLAQKEAEIKRKEIERLTKQQATKSGIPYVDLIGFSISPEALSLVPEEEAKRLSVICFYYDGANIRLGTMQPHNDEVQNLAKQLAKKHHCQSGVYLISDHSLDYGLKLYKTLPKHRDTERGVKIDEAELNKYSEKFSSFKDLQEQINKAQLTEMVVMIMAAAIKSRASDIHIEGEEKDIKIRFRIDGVLHDAAVLNKEVWAHLISRMKMLAKVKINITDKPQDGRVSIILANDRIDIRASFLPTAFGESVVMRLLHSSSIGLTFEDLGIIGRAFEQLESEIERPNGMIITTGPTGSGKTTSLYAILKKLNKQETKIITIEDPIEYQLEGINQSQISERY